MSASDSWVIPSVRKPVVDMNRQVIQERVNLDIPVGDIDSVIAQFGELKEKYAHLEGLALAPASTFWDENAYQLVGNRLETDEEMSARIATEEAALNEFSTLLESNNGVIPLTADQIEAQDRVLRSSIPAAIVRFAKSNHQWADLTRFQDRLLELAKKVSPFGDGLDAIIDFATHVPGADVRGIQSSLTERSRMGIRGRDIIPAIAAVPGADLESLVDEVKAINDPYLAFRMAKVDGVDLAAMERIVLNAESPHLSCKFVDEIPGANIKAHEEVILEKGSAGDVVDFIKSARIEQGGPDLDIPALQELAMTGFVQPVYQFADVPGADLSMIRARLAYLSEHSTSVGQVVARRYIGLFDGRFGPVPEFTPQPPRPLTEKEQRVQEHIIESGNPHEAVWFAVSHPKTADMPALQKVVADAGNSNLMYDMALHIHEGLSVRDLQSSITDVSTAIRFVRDIPGSSLEIAQDMIIAHGNPEQLYQFARKVPDADRSLIRQRIESIVANERGGAGFLRKMDKLMPDTASDQAAEIG